MAKTLDNTNVTNLLFIFFNKILAVPTALFRFFLGMFKSPKEAFKTLLADLGDITKPFRDLVQWFQDKITGWVDRFRSWVKDKLGLEDEVTTFDGITNKQFNDIVVADKNKDGILSKKERELAGTGFGGQDLTEAINALKPNQFKKLGDAISYSAALLGEGISVRGNLDRDGLIAAASNQFLNASTNVGDTVNIHKYQGPSMPSMSAMDRRHFNKMNNFMMQ